MRCGPTWPRSGEQLPSPHTFWGAQGGVSTRPLCICGVRNVWGQPHPSLQEAEERRSCQTPQSSPTRLFRDQKKPATNSHLLVATAKIPKGDAGRGGIVLEFGGNMGEDLGAEPWGPSQEQMVQGPVPALSQWGSAAPSKFKKTSARSQPLLLLEWVAVTPTLPCAPILNSVIFSSRFGSQNLPGFHSSLHTCSPTPGLSFVALK